MARYQLRGCYAMAEFFSINYDYCLFFCGISFIILTTLTFPLARRKEELIPFIYGAVFCLLYGLTVWLEVIAMGVHDSVMFKVVRTTLYFISFSVLLEFGRATTAVLNTRIPGRWIHAPFLAFALAGGIFGIEGLNASVRYFIGFPGALWIGWGLWRYRLLTKKKRVIVMAAMVLAVLFALALAAVPPPALFFPASVLNEAVFMSVAGFPIQLVQGIIGITASLAAWRYSRVQQPKLSPTARRHRIIREITLISSIVIIVTGGWIITDLSGKAREDEQHNNVLSLTNTATAALDSRKVERLTGTAADLVSPDYRRLKKQLTEMKKAVKDIRFYYLMSMVNDTVIFLVDSEPEGSPDYSPPGQVYEEIDPHYRAALNSKKTVITGPASDRWGTWVSGSAPVFSNDGRIIAFFGLDIEASKWNKMIAAERLRTILMVMFFSCMVLLFYSAQRRSRETQEIMESVAGEQSLLLNTIGTQIWFLTNPETYGMVNEAHAAFLGRNVIDVSYHNLEGFLPEDETRDRIESNREVFASGKRAEYESWYTNGQFELRYVRVIKTPKLDAQGNVEYLVCSAEDITDRKLIEADLRISEARFRSYFEMSLTGIAITTMDKYWIEVNDRLCEIMGRSRQEFRDITWEEMTHPEDLAADLEQFDSLLRGEIESYYMDKRFIRKDGGIVWASLAVGCVRNPDGTTDFILALIQDISDRKRAEAALRESEERYRLIAENSSDVIWTMSMDGRFQYVSPSVTELTGFTVDEVKNIPLSSYILPEYIPGVIEELRRELQKPREDRIHTKTLEIQQFAKDGSAIDIEVNTSWIFNEEGEPVGIQGASRDIRERKMVEAELAKSLEEKGALLRELQHRVKNSLTLIVALVDLESHRVEDSATQLVLEQLRDRIMSLSNLYDLLYRSEDVRDVRLDHYLEQICRSILESYVSDSDRIKLTAQMGEVRVRVKSAIPLGLAVNEILTNALKYAFPDGRQGLITVTLQAGTDTLLLEVSDDGRGIPLDFDEKASKGMGSQLIRMMIQQLKGTLSVEKGAGTVYRIEIPMEKL